VTGKSSCIPSKTLAERHCSVKFYQQRFSIHLSTSKKNNGMGITIHKTGLLFFLSLYFIFSNSWTSFSQAAPLPSDLRLQQALSGTESQAWALQNLEELRRFYKARNYQRAWNKTLLPQLITALNNSRLHGLTPCDYRVNILENETIDELQREVVASDAYLILAGHILSGKVDPVSIAPSWSVASRQRDLVQHLTTALESGEIEESLNALSPHCLEYSTFKNGLAHYRKIAHLGGWGQVTPGRLLKLGSHDERVVQLRSRLLKSGDLEREPSNQDPALFSPALEKAVKKFQQRANLETDGLVGPATLRNLNKTPVDRINTLRINMERWRWLPKDLGQTHIRVNVAGFYLEIREQDQEPRTHKVIVGLGYRQTPIFSNTIKYLDFNPYWYAPRRLATKDKLPMFRNDPDYFHRAGFELLDRKNQIIDAKTVDWDTLSINYFPYVLRQRPGPHNALGRVKFIFPNKHNVYLHDTPSQELFSKVQRIFSSGCIRVQQPLDLAQLLLTGQDGWNREQIDTVVEGGKRIRVILKEPVPIHILYWTALVDRENSEIRFIDDIYQRDEQILQSLDTMCPTAK
jgi:L,D-transpeptidase YcbB